MTNRKKSDRPRTVQGDPKKQDGASEDSFNAAAEKIGKRLGAVKVVIGAVAGLLLVLATTGKDLLQQWNSWFAKPAPREEACVVVNTPSIPPVKLSEWEETRFVLEGRNNCSTRRGVYVTFQRSQARGPIVRPPRFDKEGCDRGEPVTKTECWTQKIPLEKGPWQVAVPLPPLERLTNPRPNETILLTIEVRDLENPDKLPEWSHVATIEQRNDL
jgi:hypothetical protein